MIAGRIPGRTDNEIKNYWNTHLSKKLISQGIDPRTHKPLNPNSNSSSAAKLAASSSKLSPLPNPKANASNSNNISPTPINEETPSDNTDGAPAVNQESNGYFESTHLYEDHYQAAAGTAGMVDSAMRLRGNNNVLLTNEEDDDDINYCSDDVFSSFLNSLINEDAFNAQQHPPNGINATSSDPLISISAQGFGWESAVLMSSTFGQNDPKRVDAAHDHVK